ncbi:uncharacterized protein MONBRDRAFT_11220 [Monosiga brevicollis MX1]|uniref:J domain-containing protein n=1 Tax=Monosiga brevicollis TaxID=81824 RepID=A9V8K2_MONBE|nr:uncharacterized protein MONBRDRAFT_11220 [Monosiga brevicollis MX1]EDQ86159.1 predicted protein [Monosiga brevicollis MX1]|eukprot:XP_001749084.1 hypothetical protein [Monosiga brevicollis MX1]
MSEVIESKRLRVRGNAHYQGASAPGLAPVLVEARLKDAIRLYYQAETAAGRNILSRASAHKNLAMAHARLFEAHVRRYTARVGAAGASDALPAAEQRMLTHYALTSMRSFASARLDGLQAHGSHATWTIRLMIEAGRVASEMAEALGTIEPRRSKRACILGSWIQTLRGENPVPDTIAHLAMAQRRVLFREAVQAHSQEKLSDALSILGEAEEADSTAQQAAQKACRLHAEDLAELRIGSEEIHIQGRVIRSLHMIREGLRLEQSALWDDENLLMDLVWDSVDAYHEAIFVSDGADLAQEAEAIARLGIIYSKILKQPVRGKNYCVKALNLASSLHPRVFTFVPWHQTASDIVKAYQEELVARERSAWEAKRKPYLEKLAPELKKLEEASTEGLDSLIDMIYDKHPPLNKKHTKPTAEGKKRIQHAIRHYHPDKGNVSEETKVLLEEIY